MRRGTAAGRSGFPASYDPETQALHLRHRQSDAGLHGRRPQGRQPVHVLAGRGQRRHGQDGVVLPDLAARHARLGFGADARPHRRHDQRQAAQARLHRGAQRLLLHGRSRHRRARRDQQVTARPRTGRQACARTASPEPNPEKEATIPGSLVSPVEGGVDQLAAAGLLPGHRVVLRAGAQRLQHAVPHRSGSARIDGARRQDRRSASDRGGNCARRHRLPRRARPRGATPGHPVAAAAPAC